MKETEFILRRVTESFPDWTIGIPVLFAYLVLFIVASFRRGSSSAGLFWGLGIFFLVPLCLVTRPTAPSSAETLVDVLLFYARDFVGAVVFAGFAVYFVQDLLQTRRLGVVGGLFVVVPIVLYFVWAPLDMPVYTKVLPAYLLFLAEVLVLVWRTRLWLGLAFVTGLTLVYLPLAILFKPAFTWWVVLVPLLVAALFYVVLMYLRDAQSIHPAWAAFLGLLRCSVYAILAFVFLLPGCQTLDQTEIFPRVLVLFDVSGSMKTKDDLLEPGQNPKTLLTRQDKVWNVWSGNVGPDKKERPPFLERLLEKSPFTAYRFGSIADEAMLTRVDKESTWTRDEWKTWLNPDKKDIAVSTLR